MRRHRITALVHKVTLEMTRSGPLPFLYYVVLSMMVQFSMLKRLQSAVGASDMVTLAPATFLFIAPVVIPFTAIMLIQRRLMQEQLLGSLAVLLATGTRPGDVWLAKVLAGFSLSYVCMALALALNFGLTTLVLGHGIALSATMLMIVAIVSPLGCLAMLGLLAFSVIVFRTTAIGGVLALVILVVIQQFSLRMVKQPELLISISYLAALAAVVTLGLLYTAVNALPRRRFVGM